MTELAKMTALIRDASASSERASNDFARSLSALIGVPIVVDHTLKGSNIRIQVSQAMFQRMQQDFQQ